MTLEVSRRSHMAVIAAAAALTVALAAGLIWSGSALADHYRHQQATTLNGDWAPFNRCPVDDPAMLAANGESNIALCLADISASGSLTIGKLTVPTKGSNHQFGIVLSNEGQAPTVVAPPGGALEDEPVEVPGGLQELICPSDNAHFGWLRQFCRHPLPGDDHRNKVMLTLEVAGAPSNFALLAGLTLGNPLLTVPVKIHLQNQFLGDDCYIGSVTEPIVLQPANTAIFHGEGQAFAGDGTPEPGGENVPMFRFVIFSNQAAAGFTVPAAQGCGHWGTLDRAINANVGLPAPAGQSSVAFNENVGYLTGINNPARNLADGTELSQYWHSAVVQAGSSDEGPDHHDAWHHRRWTRQEAETWAGQSVPPSWHEAH